MCDKNKNEHTLSIRNVYPIFLLLIYKILILLIKKRISDSRKLKKEIIGRKMDGNCTKVWFETYSI